MFDLPGGGIEFSEKVEESVRREFLEETGTTVTDIIFLGYNECVSQYNNERGESRKLHHLGLYHVVSISNPDEVKTDADGEDSLGAVFIDIENIDNYSISPIALPMILKAILAIKK